MSWLSNIGKAVGKGVKDTGHAIGDAANNKWVKGGTAALLAATGVGAPAAAAILASEGLAGGALHRGGGLKDAAVGGATGALAGGGAALAGKGLSMIPGIGGIAGKVGGLVPGLGSQPGAMPNPSAGVPDDGINYGATNNGYAGGAPTPGTAPGGLPGSPQSGWEDKIGGFLHDHGLALGTAALGAYSSGQANKQLRTSHNGLQSMALSPNYNQPGLTQALSTGYRNPFSQGG